MFYTPSTTEPPVSAVFFDYLFNFMLVCKVDQFLIVHVSVLHMKHNIRATHYCSLNTMTGHTLMRSAISILYSQK